MKLDCNFHRGGKNLNQEGKLLYGRVWVDVHIFWNETKFICLAKIFNQQLSSNNWVILADKFASLHVQNSLRIRSKCDYFACMHA